MTSCENFNEKVITILNNLTSLVENVSTWIDRNLDKEKCKEYLSLFDDGVYKEFAQLVIKETRYINHEKFLEDLNYSFDKFLKNIKSDSCLVYFDNMKFESKNWILSIMWSKLKQAITVEDIFVKPVVDVDWDTSGTYDGKNMVIFDDCSYSGCDLCEIIDFIQYTTKSKNMVFHLIVPYISKYALAQIRCVSTSEIHFYNRYEPMFLLDTMPEELRDVEMDIARFFDLQNLGIPIYFDHMMGSNSDTFPSIYEKGYYMWGGEKLEFGSILKESPNMKPIEEIGKYFDKVMNISCTHLEKQIASKATLTYENLPTSEGGGDDIIANFCRSNVNYLQELESLPTSEYTECDQEDSSDWSKPNRASVRNKNSDNYTTDDFLADSSDYLYMVLLLPKGKSMINDVSVIISDKLYLGCEIKHKGHGYPYTRSNVTYKKLHDLGITHILDVKNEYKDDTTKFNVKHIPVPDTETVAISTFFDDAIKYIDDGKKVYVHCVFGKSRSASIVIAYVAVKFNMNFVDAYNYVYERRNCIDPSLVFKLQLASYIGQ